MTEQNICGAALELWHSHVVYGVVFISERSCSPFTGFVTGNDRKGVNALGAKFRDLPTP
ncbi:MAG: hypothetical protein KF855_13530 [Acidobacteria bacterium]|nr:hypothetical protein [Acidobacteriota bacterium]